MGDDAVLGGLGRGFDMGQHRLGYGRIRHGMWSIAKAQAALDMATARALERSTFGKPLAERQGIQWMLADCAADLYISRLMVLHIAYKMERGLDLLIVWRHGEHRDRFALAEQFEGVREWIRRRWFIAQRDGLPRDGLRDGFGEELVAVHVRVDGVAEQEVPRDRVLCPHGLESRIAIRETERFGFREIADGLRILGELRHGPLRRMPDVRRQQEDVALLDLHIVDLAALGDLQEHIALELIEEFLDRIVVEIDAPPDAEPGGGRPRFYRITPLGRRACAAEAQRLASFVDVARRKKLLKT